MKTEKRGWNLIVLWEGHATEGMGHPSMSESLGGREEGLD